VLAPPNGCVTPPPVGASVLAGFADERCFAGPPEEALAHGWPLLEARLQGRLTFGRALITWLA